MAGHYPGILMTGHIGTNTPKFVPPRWGRPPFDPTQTGLCKFGRVSLELAEIGAAISGPRRENRPRHITKPKPSTPINFGDPSSCVWSSLIRTLLRVACCCMTPLVCTQPGRVKCSRFWGRLSGGAIDLGCWLVVPVTCTQCERPKVDTQGAPKGDIKREKPDPERTFSQIFADFR